MRAENTELMLSFQKGQVTKPQYKVTPLFKLCSSYSKNINSPSFLIPQLLLSSLREIYQTLEDELDRNSNHPAVEPIYFPSELARLESIEKDLDYFYGPDWKERIVVPAATRRYCDRLREVGFLLMSTRFTSVIR